MTNATKNQSLVLSTEYDKILAELKGDGTVAVLSGKEIYDVRCASCHKFEQKLVGPAHFDVLPKYVGKQAQLIAFIRNPVKVDPAYPPMPNPGLKTAGSRSSCKIFAWMNLQRRSNLCQIQFRTYVKEIYPVSLLRYNSF